jgi:glycolate oxidase
MPTPPNLPALLENLLGKSAVISNPDALAVYECDAFTIPKARPFAVIFPQSTEQVAAAAKLLHDLKVPLIPRGAGTGLAGGIVAVTPAVQLSLARMNRILELDLRNRTALVEPGVANWALSHAVNHSIYHFAPDPSSQRASTIGGNAATNAGGLHTLKYGVTVNHILGLEVVLEDGTIHTTGGPHGHTLGPDLTGLIIGTEGTLAIITRIWCRLTPKPVAFRTAIALFNHPQDACRAVADIIAAGIIPAALEMMDQTMIGIVEDAFALGLPKSAGALLLIEVDGQDITIQNGNEAQSSLDADLAEIRTICQKHAATSFDASADPKRRAELWSARKRAFGAIGRITPSYCTQDACVPRSRLPEVIAFIAQISAKYRLRITNCFHAGDGNLHPAIMFDNANPDDIHRTLEAAHEILRYCISIGGVATGEHGVGIEKLPLLRDMFSPDDLAAMHAIRNAFSPRDLFNPFKSLPRDGIDIDLLHPGRHVPQ